MANTDNPNGFVPIRSLAGVEPRMSRYTVNSGQVIALGDAVIFTGGYVQIALSNSGSLGGVAAGAAAPASGTGYIYVYDDPETIFEGQCSGTFAQDDVGKQCDIEGTTGIMEVNEDATTETVITILEMSKKSNNALGANARVQFKITRHQLAGDQTA